MLERGFTKLVQQFDDLESSREGAGTKETSAGAVRRILEEVGLDSNIAQYNEMGGLSGGQRVKVVIAATLWNNPQVQFLFVFLMTMGRSGRVFAFNRRF